MKIHLHIDRLLLEELPIDRQAAPRVQAAVEQALAQLVQDQGLPAGLTSAALAKWQGGVLQVATGQSPEDLGQGIAQAIYGGLGS